MPFKAPSPLSLLSQPVGTPRENTFRCSFPSGISWDKFWASLQSWKPEGTEQWAFKISVLVKMLAAFWIEIKRDVREDVVLSVPVDGVWEPGKNIQTYLFCFIDNNCWKIVNKIVGYFNTMLAFLFYVKFRKKLPGSDINENDYHYTYLCWFSNQYHSLREWLVKK